MACETLRLPDGGTAIVCSGRAARCSCGRRGTLQCDWKVPTRRSGTCDAYLCESCTTSPAPEKDLCPKHARKWRAWQDSRRAVGGLC